MFILTPLLLLIGGGTGLLLGRNLQISIRRPLDRMDEIFGLIAANDIGTHVRYPIEPVAEFSASYVQLKGLRAKMIASKNEMEDNTRWQSEQRQIELDAIADKMENRVKSVVEAISRQSQRLSGNASRLSVNVHKTETEAGSANVQTAQVLSNVQAVSAATQEMSASISEISRQVAHSAKIAKAAVLEAGNTNAIMQRMTDTAANIGEVVSLINDIASQTNLLALNATIEAARAGDAGKGFAVVAGEVKNLANQTARATDEIAKQIAEMQLETKGAVTAIDGIGQTISNIDELSSAIAAAVEEQGGATAEIARSSTDAAHATESVFASVRIVAGAAKESEAMSTEVSQSVDSVQQEVVSLDAEVSGFLRELRRK